MQFQKHNSKASILLIYTGGTIGMKEDPIEQTLKPFDFKQILEAVPELGKFACRIDSYTFDPLIDSSDVEPSMWQALAALIRDNYDSYDGFVVLHGTDTMAYSASALSFMLENLEKPVIFTGSQLPIGKPRTDGRENLISAVEIASTKNEEGRAMVPEVAIFFDSVLLRGNRSTKVKSEQFDAFQSYNCPPLAEAGISIRYNSALARPVEQCSKSLTISEKLDTRVSILKVHPGITPQVVKNILLGPETRAVIIETYGSGNAPTKDWFIRIVEEAASMDKILVNVSQCLCGSVNMSLYATGKKLEDAGVISGHDLTTESALAKLFYLMGKYAENHEVKRLMGESIRGEISK